MLSGADNNGSGWLGGVAMDGAGDENDSTSDNGKLGGLAGLNPMFEDDWYLGSSTDASPSDSLLLQAMDSSSSCSPPSVTFNLEASQSLFPQKEAAIASLLSVLCSNPGLEPQVEFVMGCDDAGFLEGDITNELPDAVLVNREGGGLDDRIPGFPGLSPCAPVGSQDPRPRLSETEAVETSTLGTTGAFFEGFPLFNRPKVLQPLKVLPPDGAQPTLFQKRAASLRQNSGTCGAGALADESKGGSFKEQDCEEDARRSSDEIGGATVDANADSSGLNYDSDDATPEINVKVEDNINASNANIFVSEGAAHKKGKKRAMPAKNLMAERRRRKKLNDRLYMLRSVVPKISKMDRASILGDAIEYLKELLQKIGELHSELESTPCSSPLPTSTITSLYPPSLSPPAIPWRVKEELSPSPLSSPCSQIPSVEVRERDGHALNIHMLCARRPGLLLSTMSALDSLGLDIQQAVISCFNGFVLDVFRAERCKEDPGVRAEEIKALLLHTAGSHGAL